MMNSKVVIVVVIAMLALIGFGAWVWGGQQETVTPRSESTSTTNGSGTVTPRSDESANVADENAAKGDAAGANEVVIRYTDNGFDAQTYTVMRGQTVRVVNESSRTLEFSSDDHPTHRINAEFNLAPLEPGKEATVSPSRAGSWGIHDHLKASETTAIVVNE